MLRMIFCCLVTVVWAPTCCLLVLLVRLITFKDSAAYALFRFWARSTFLIGGIRRVPVGLDAVDLSQPRIYVANHPTSFDPLVMMSVIPGRLSAVGKKELRRIPIIGWVMMACGWLFIDRGNLEKAKRSIAAAGEKIRGGLPVLIFPEGKRTGTPRELQEFKKGPFHMALEAQVPLQPARIVGWEKMIEPGSRIPRSGTIEIRFGKEVVPVADDGVEDLRRKVRAEMELLLGEASTA
ncbi:MAG: 1-acyl-sn-glycerol-3-phosphate acyltransferase [Deltaproteobacteria bacterium]|nr:1-acyl-sn-glycerol-3-phosphate acyltransferase [Deltaproteobacteria bacterium]